MAKDLCSGSVRIGGSCGDDCSISDGTERQQEEQEAQRLGGISTQVVGLEDVEGGGVIATERCIALLLPKELSRRVFSQLDYRDLVQCSLVCKYACRLCADVGKGQLAAMEFGDNRAEARLERRVKH